MAPDLRRGDDAFLFSTYTLSLYHSITLSLYHFITLSLRHFSHSVTKKTARWAVFRCTISRILYCPGAVITTAIGVASIINLHPMLPPDVKPSTRPLVGTL